MVLVVIFQTLEDHDWGDLPVGDELLAEVEKFLQIRSWKVVCLVRVWIAFGDSLYMTRRWARSHQSMAREERLILNILVGLPAKVFSVISARCLKCKDKVDPQLGVSFEDAWVRSYRLGIINFA
jgi:hypothetical protein